ncbi:hypothetical protein F441_01957 [Phytophthora nicotianae CJ01A1]|uniref:Uncharacterized protein n=1 Tax=Phytophthora nicotianae CJ01A1 TaxID=1317063 RepID=W2XQK8_PHYNI|nr:hypothetical protein F441_01957 [Phytophthora nicotianae CJ01A1]
MASPKGSSSPRRQSLFDVASDLIASFRDRQPLGGDITVEQHGDTGVATVTEHVVDEGGVEEDHSEEKIEDNDTALNETLTTGEDQKSDSYDSDDDSEDDSNDGDSRTEDSAEDEESRDEFESKEPIGTGQIDPMILETEQGQGVDTSEESDGSGVSSSESSNSVQANPSTDVSGHQGVSYEQGESPRKTNLFAQAVSSVVATLLERRSSLTSTPVTSGANGNGSEMKAGEHSQSIGIGRHDSGAGEVVGEALELTSSAMTSSLDLVAEDELVRVDYQTAATVHENLRHSETHVEDTDNNRDHDAASVTRSAEHVLALKDEDADHVTISIQDSPKPRFKKANSKATGLTALPPVGETAKAVKTVGTALLDVLRFLPVTKMTKECLEKLKSQTATKEALDSSILQDLRDLGEILGGKPVPRLSLQCYEAIESMKNEGKMLSMDHIVEIRDSHALEFCAKPPQEYESYGVPGLKLNEIKIYKETKLAELRAAVASCNLTTLEHAPIPELLALWSLVHSSVSSKISANVAQQVAVEVKQPMQQKLGNKTGSLRFVGGEVVAEQDVQAGGDEDLIDTSDAAALANRIARNGLVGMKDKLAMSRLQVDTMLQSFREQRQMLVGGVIAGIIARFPPLLRIEIVRDFFQIAGLFFDGLYDPVLEFFRDYHPPGWILLMITWLRKVYNVIALDASKLLRNLSKELGTAILLSCILLIHFAFLIMVIRFWWKMPRMADKVRHGHEATTWASYASQNARTTKLTTIFLTVILTLYLPLTQLAFNVLVVTHDKHDHSSAEKVGFMHRYRDGPLWFFFPLEAIFLLLTFTLGLPILLIWSIWKNRPNGSLEDEDYTYDLDGEEVPFDDKVYTELVSSDPSQLGCPFRSLYAGFERSWSIYKVLQMIAKTVLALIVVAAAKSVRISGLLISICYFFVVGLSKYSQPFIDPVDDLMELISKTTALTTAVGATAVAYVSEVVDTSPNAVTHVNRFMGFVVVVHWVNMVAMLVALAFGVSALRVQLKRLTGWLSFSDTSRGIDDGRAKTIIPYWDIAKEAKHRVWQAFWRAILLELAVPTSSDDVSNQKWKGGGSKDVSVKGTDRLASLEEAVVASGLKRVESHWFGTEHVYTTQLRRLAREALEGVDVYWNNPFGARDGHLDSVTCFGKMYVVPYPFHCVVVYDDAEDEAIIRDDCEKFSPLKSYENLSKLLFLNFTPDIMKKRELRQKLRVLSDTKTQIMFVFERTEKVFLWPRILEWKRWKCICIPVILTPGFYKFKCKYKKGIIRVQSNSDKAGTILRMSKSGAMQRVRKWLSEQKWLQKLKIWITKVSFFQTFFKPTQPNTEKKSRTRIMADGFNVTMKYKDGTGVVEIPDSDYRIKVKGPRKALMKADHIGLKPTMEESETLSMIFKATESVWKSGLKELREKHRKYRHELIAKHENENAALSDTFWFFVYYNPHLARNKLETYLREHETNPLLQNLPKKHKLALDALYLRQKWVYLNPRQTCWYVFWDDVYARNSGMKKYLKREDFDPLLPTSICYMPPMEKKDLENWLAQRKLLGRWKSFHPDLINMLYDKMSAYEKKLKEDRKQLMKRLLVQSIRRLDEK